ncbi:hypothetical protein [Enterococcus sp. AZ109]|uniref:hypothetical protein n=1 Tax=Enterococcus sp. AZ109 TaxID=2774634 RepID=UPI003F1F5CA2
MKRFIAVILLISTLLLTACNHPETNTTDSTHQPTSKERSAKKSEEQAKAKQAEKEQKAHSAKLTAEADEALRKAENDPNDYTYEAAKAAIEAIPEENEDLNTRLESLAANLAAIKQQNQAVQSQQQAPDQTFTPGYGDHNANIRDARYQEAIANGASEQDAVEYAEGRSSTYHQQEPQQTQPTTLTEFVNQYGMSPVAYKTQVEGMSEEEALRSTPTGMKSSGEIQLGIIQYGIQP